LFEFIRDHRDLTRLAFVTAFAAKGEVPDQAGCCQKGLRNFEFLHELIKRGVATGELTTRFDTEEMAMGFVGMMHLHIMVYLIDFRGPPTRRTANHLVELFLRGARAA
jgi:hypothetical protein